MPQGGKLTISLANITRKSSGRRSKSEFTGDYVLLKVKDTGVGIQKPQLAHIFEPFYSTKPMAKGTGLGLAIVHGIVVQNGGHIEVDSSPGSGTVFSIYLPRIHMPLMEQAGVEPLENVGGTETILLVEDETVVRDMAATALIRNGYTVLRASGGLEAIELAEQHVGPIHLLLTDMLMPQMGGGEVARRMTEVRPEIKVLFTTGYTDDELVSKAMLNAGLRLLQKPYSLALLTHLVRTTLDGPDFALLLAKEPQ
jgi:CheY-like chemotaxis protein